MAKSGADLERHELLGLDRDDRGGSILIQTGIVG